MITKDLDKAVTFHREGQLVKAENIYLEIIDNDKNNSQVLQLLGTLYLQKKREPKKYTRRVFCKYSGVKF